MANSTTVEKEMGVDEDAHRLRDILVRRLVSNTSRERLSAALEEKSRFARMDAIGDVIRQSSLKCHMCMINGAPHIYDGTIGIYRPFQWAMLEDAVYVAMRRLKVKDGDYAKVEQYCKIIRRAIASRTCEPDPAVVVMSNGVYDTRNFTFCGFSHDIVAISRVDYPYDGSALCVKWKNFLNEVLPSAPMQRLLQEFVAACYVDRRKVKMEKMMFLKGSGSNGKSVVFEVILSLLGEDNVSTFAVSELTGSLKERNLAACNGKRLNYCSELRTSELGASNSDAFKSLVSGEPMMARALYRDPFKATCIPLLMANCNQMPVMRDPSLSLSRRILIMPFDQTIEESRQDKTLADALKDELPGIFNWAMEGLVSLMASSYDFDIPRQVQELVDRYISDSTPVLRWLEERRYHCPSRAMKHDREECMTAMRLYGEFREWMSARGEQYVGRSDFLRLLEANGFAARRHAEGMTYRVYVGMSEEEFLELNQRLAERLLREKKVSEIEEKLASAVQASDDGTKWVTGVNEAERYLGLPMDTIWDYLRTGRLDICAKKTTEGWMFNVVELQRVLSFEGYYAELEFGEENLRKRARKSLERLRHAFNVEMKRLGQPYRQFDKVSPNALRDEGVIWVPDGWTFSCANIKKVTGDRKKRTESALDRLMDRQRYKHRNENKINDKPHGKNENIKH